MIKEIAFGLAGFALGMPLYMGMVAEDLKIASNYKSIRPGDWFMKASEFGDFMMTIPGGAATSSGLKRCEELLSESSLAIKDRK